MVVGFVNGFYVLGEKKDKNKYESNILNDPNFIDWYEGLPEKWKDEMVFLFSKTGKIVKEEENVKSGEYSLKFITNYGLTPNGVRLGSILVGQLIENLNPNSDCLAKCWAKGHGKACIVVLNNSSKTATKIYNFNNNTWENFSGFENISNNNLSIKEVSHNEFSLIEFDEFTVPENGKILIFFGQYPETKNDVIYIDDVFFSNGTENLLENSGFENWVDGDENTRFLKNWVFFSSNVIRRETNEIYSYPFSIYSLQNEFVNYFYQVVDVESNKKYQAKIYAKGNTENNNISILLLDGDLDNFTHIYNFKTESWEEFNGEIDSDNFDTKIISNNEFKEYVFKEFLTSSTSGRLCIFFIHNLDVSSGECYFDDVFLGKISNQEGFSLFKFINPNDYTAIEDDDNLLEYVTLTDKETKILNLKRNGVLNTVLEKLDLSNVNLEINEPKNEKNPINYGFFKSFSYTTIGLLKNIDFRSTGLFELTTVQENKAVFIRDILFVFTDVEDVSSNPTISIGTDEGNHSEIINNHTFGNIQQNKVIILSGIGEGGYQLIFGNKTIKLKISNGASASKLIGNVYIIGMQL